MKIDKVRFYCCAHFSGSLHIYSASSRIVMYDMPRSVIGLISGPSARFCVCSALCQCSGDCAASRADKRGTTQRQGCGERVRIGEALRFLIRGCGGAVGDGVPAALSLRRYDSTLRTTTFSSTPSLPLGCFPPRRVFFFPPIVRAPHHRRRFSRHVVPSVVPTSSL